MTEKLKYDGRLNITRTNIDKVIENLTQFGNPRSLNAALRGEDRYTAALINLKYLSSKAIKQDKNTENAYNFFEKIFNIGTSDEIRKKGKGRRKELYNPKGYTESIALELKIQPQTLRRIIRIFRLILVYEAINDETINHNDNFYQTIKQLCDLDSNLPPSQRDKNLSTLFNKWDGSISNFYRLVYQLSPNGSWLGRFFPYEIDFFKEFLVRLKGEKGMNIFTKKMLSIILSDNRQHWLKEIKDETGIPVDHNTIPDLISIILDDLLIT